MILVKTWGYITNYVNTNKKIIAWSMTLIMLLNLVITGSIPAFAHDSLLNVEYDPCYNGILNDGIDETWYIFSRISEVYHIDHEVNTIKYYFELEADEEDNISDYFWTDVPEALAEEVQTAYANSMKKWNNVYFYSYNSDGSITKNKVINIVEGTKEDHNLSIYPALGLQYIATTGRLGAHAEEGNEKLEIESAWVELL